MKRDYLDGFDYVGQELSGGGVTAVCARIAGDTSCWNITFERCGLPVKAGWITASRKYRRSDGPYEAEVLAKAKLLIARHFDDIVPEDEVTKKQIGKLIILQHENPHLWETWSVR